MRFVSLTHRSRDKMSVILHRIIVNAFFSMKTFVYRFKFQFGRVELTISYNYTPRNEVRGGILDSPCLSVCLSVCPSVCPLTFRVRPVASTVQDGFFPYLVQRITSMRGCVACDDLWPWPISSRSFGLDLENRVRSVASTVLDGFFLYLAQIVTIIRGCVACYVFFQYLKIWIFWQIFEIFWPWPWKKNLQFLMDSFHI